MAVAYIPRTRELYKAFAPYRWVVNHDVPWTPLKKPLSESRLALACSGGILYRDQPRFHREDTSYRRVPKDASRAELTVWHFGYRTEDVRRDPNCVFPLERMRELEAEGLIGELMDPALSFMGGVYSARRVRTELGPALIEEVRAGGADALLLVPA
ncbi:MAG: glycine/betaine/sarcosine/D-proline family reductase selenoprotein B [Deltaproteobacteria bacterium]|jgi:D-proline reductase (dithiol) PrdB|nr:glycine/betaine/sarcosine/D-proline family reductase selenoprotein B [Deltaproteobacteria bacterium]